MILITCVDKNKGMLFNNRRQSKDRNLIKHICKMVKNNKIWINSFSKDLFEEQKYSNIIVDDEFINKIKEEEYCFIENISPVTLENKISKIILYSWDREYPADMYFNIKLENWILESEAEIKGSSHKRITQQIFIRGEK